MTVRFVTIIVKLISNKNKKIFETALYNYTCFADGFFLCELLQHIYGSTQSFKIMWLTAENNSHEIFYEDYIDYSEVAY